MFIGGISRVEVEPDQETTLVTEQLMDNTKVKKPVSLKWLPKAVPKQKDKSVSVEYQSDAIFGNYWRLN